MVKKEIRDLKREKDRSVPLAAQMTAKPSHRRTVGPTRRSSKGGWTKEQDEQLIRAVQKFNGKSWKKIAEYVPGKTDVMCLHRYDKVLNPNLIKGSWTKEEDDQIIRLVAQHGTKNWSIIAKSVPGRIGKQCRERWHNHLNPTIRKDPWTREEELVLIHAHKEHGNKWAEIAKRLPGRADNSIKNHWNCSMKKRLDSNLASSVPSQSTGLEQEKPVDKLSLSPKECSVNQDARPAVQATIFQPVFDKARSLSTADQKMSLENSNLQVAAKPISARDPKCRISSSEFLRFPHLEEKSPASVLSGSLFMDTTQYSTDPSHQVTNSWKTNDSDRIDASDDSDSGSVQPRTFYNFFASQFCPQIQCNSGFSNKMLDLPREPWEKVFDISDRCARGMKLKDKSVASSPETKCCYHDQITGTPLCCNKAHLGSLYDSPQLEYTEGSALSSQATNKEGDMKPAFGSINNSTPPDVSLSLTCVPSSPESFLRIAGMQYKHKPSIIRRRCMDSSKRLFAESPKKAIGEVVPRSGSAGDPFEKDVSIKNAVDSEPVQTSKTKCLFDLNIPDVSSEMEPDGCAS
ncbi:hypothetical protein J5N97_023635 [Dioscorea zingiberensis]|uniref:Uncharacterized protein n=1 Tax=Dioscorea zingiberensis TaxID=325984 RepID=A0A9D5C5M2_9LILI|nr:hypothetical protein J5N97_023635 [Dioscorea zingiberensis]